MMSAVTLEDADLRRRAAAAFRWRSDRTDADMFADVTGWWRDPDLLRDIAIGLREAYVAQAPTVVLGLQSRGVLLGAVIAQQLGVGLVEVRKDPAPSTDSDAWLTATTPPDYRDRHLTLGFRRGLVQSGDRVLLVDDWIATGGQALGARELVRRAGAAWLGLAVVVDALDDRRLRRDLGVRALLHERDLPQRPS